MNIIGRKRELLEIERCDRSKKSELVCVYGRRRVGKTYLVEQAFSDYFAFRASGLEKGNTRQQLKSFHLRLREYGDTSRSIPADWLEAFSRLEALLSKENVRRSPHGKIVVFLDEFPWFATARSDFLMAFGEFWNRCGTVHGDRLFIICGSATSWIIENVLKNTGSLYNRVTVQIALSPFTLGETEQFFREKEYDWSVGQLILCQMVFGGLPYFFELIDTDESLTSNIDRLLFAPHALLRDESKRLLEATLKKSPVYASILSYLSGYRYGVKKQECFEALRIPKGSFSRAVDDLIKCGYISEFKNPRETGKPLYLLLTDPFLLFHFTFLDAAGQSVEGSWFDFSHSGGRFHNWRGHAFETLCLYHIDKIKEVLGIHGVRTASYPWISKKKRGGAQIDLVIERDDHITNLCEIKYTDKPFSITAEYERKLLQKMDVFREETKTKDTLRLVIISMHGLGGVAHTEYISRVITAKELL